MNFSVNKGLGTKNLKYDENIVLNQTGFQNVSLLFFFPGEGAVCWTGH